MIFGEYRNVVMNRNENTMPHRWGVIQPLVNKFHCFLVTVQRRKESGHTMEMHLKHALLMYKKWSKGKDFSLMHVFTKLESCPKWAKTRFTLNDGAVIDVDGIPMPLLSASVGSSIGNKKA